MKIKYLKIKNFLSIGEQPLEIDFTKFGNIVNIKGRNLDGVDGTSNASGKTSILNALSYAFYGKLIKNLSHKEAINNKSKKGLEVELHWDNYKIIRKRAPDRLHLWENDKEISLGGIPATDELVRNIIKLNHNSFINVACFGQHNNYAFLSCDPAEKRQIAENLLSLDKYVKFNKTAKDKNKILKEKTNQLSLLYQKCLGELSSIQKKSIMVQGQRQQWRDNKLREISSTQIKLSDNKNKINELKSKKEIKDYENIQQELVKIEQEVEKKEKIRIDLHIILEKADNAIQQRRDEKQNLSIEVSSCERELVIIAKEITQLESSCNHIKSQEGAICDHCYGDITSDNISMMMERDIDKIKDLQTKWNEINKKKNENKEKYNACENNLAKLIEGRKLARDKETLNNSALSAALDKQKELTKVSQPGAMNDLTLVEKDIQHLTEKLEQLHGELDSDPYISMIEMVNEEMQNCDEQVNIYKKDIQDIESQVPYYNFWTKAFGDDGIRAFVIDEIIPALNARVNYWLQFLMDGKIQVNFNNQLDEIIQRVPADQDLFVYNGLSGGEHCRIDLAISQAFAHIMMMTSGTCPSIVALDEVGANIDRPGIQAIYKMICELARDRQVLVITHDPDLLDLLSGYDTIEVVKKNGITIRN